MDRTSLPRRIHLRDKGMTQHTQVNRCNLLKQGQKSHSPFSKQIVNTG